MTYVAAAAAAAFVTVIVLTAAPPPSTPLIASVNALVADAARAGTATENAVVDVAVGDKTEEFCFSVKDEGRGFDFNGLPDPTAPENLLKEGGRGIFLMKNLSDDLVYNSSGNSVSIYFVK